jgi:23S rRNA (uracil1939-C5)-methyltransferase
MPLTVSHLGARGDGVAGDHYVPGALPGDAVELDAQGKAFVTVKGPHHVSPPCAHFGDCGGCLLQHADAALYADWISRRILMPLGEPALVPERITPAHVSPMRSRRRVVMKALRTAQGLVLGFNREASHQLVDVQDCVIANDAINALLLPLRSLLIGWLKPGSAVTLHMTQCDNGIDLMIAGVTPPDLARRETLTAFANQQDVARLSVRTSVDCDIIVERRAPALRFGGVPVLLPVESFSQATPDGEAAMIAAVMESIGTARKLADLFSGIGTFSLPLSTRATVHAVEGSRSAVQALKRAADSAGRPLSTEHRDLFRRPLMASELNRFEAVVFDPPRAGAPAQCAELAKSKVPRVIAVSCNPNTFARDAQLLAQGGYRIETLWPIGQFLWSTHVELVALFRRA